ncbi:hypothetical protein ABPG75_000642 [Micractinium tetrahymenae]
MGGPPLPPSACPAVGEALHELHRQASAYQALLGLGALPQNGRQAQAAARQLGAVVLPGVAPPPLLSQLVAEELAARPPAKARFVDVSTGLRLRYLEWGPSGSSEVVLLLHDLGEAADIWRHVGARLADRGYRVLAPDLRGHGESGRSLDGRYSAEALAEDVKALIVALDLYVAPLAVVGCGMGAAAGLALAQASPFLVGALLAAEFTLPVAAAQEAAAAAAAAGAQAEGAFSSEHGAAAASGPGRAAPIKHNTSAGSSSGSSSSPAALDSRQLLPWWGLCPGQACQFPSVEHCASLLAHPLCNLAPALLLPLEAAAAQAAAATGAAEQSASSSDSGSDAPDAGAAALRELFGQLQRPLRGAVASACSLLRLPPHLADARGGGGLPYWDDFEEDEFGEGGGLTPRMDPAFLFSFDAAALLSGLADLRCHLLLARSARGSWADTADAAAMAAAAAAGGAASAAAAPELPCTGHWLAADHPESLLQAIVGFLEGPAICCFERAALPRNGSSGSLQASSSGSVPGGLPARRPELLDLKPLPQYSSLEEAQKALGPRAIPSAAAIEAELRRLRVEEGRDASDASSDEEGEEGSGHRTGLARDPPTYFGFVG